MNTGNNTKYYSIGEVSEKTGVKQSVLRFWEAEFDELAPIKNKFGHRVYTDSDIEMINKIKYALYDEGLTIRGAKSKLFSNRHSKDKKEKTVIIEEIRSELTDLLKLLRRNNQ